MSKKAVLVMLVLSLFLVGCTTSKSPYITEHPKVTEEGAPYWTVLTPLSDDRFYGVGMGDLSTLQNSKLRAEALAKDEIARQVSTIVNSSVKNYFSESGRYVSSSNSDVFENFSQQVTNVTLTNVIIENNYTDTDGAIWVISSYDKLNLETAYKSVAENLKYNLERRRIEAEKAIALLNIKNDEQKILHKGDNIALIALKKAYAKTLAEKNEKLNSATNQYDSIDIDRLLAAYKKILNTK
jgi:hypothetical protein